jgi:hypothetical protein
VRRFTVAPPRVSIAPQRPAPPVPAVGLAPSASPIGAPTPGVVRRSPAAGASLVEATAHLFAQPDAPSVGGPVIRRTITQGGNVMPPPAPLQPSGSNAPSYAPWSQDPSGDGLPAVSGSPDPLPPGIGFDALVDAVVQRIERKVVEEMERRGRWRGGEVY